MTWDAAPWIVGGANTSAEVARTVAYASFNGQEGVIVPSQLQVRQLAIPGAGVRISPGVCSILCRHAGGDGQCYVGRLISEESPAISSTAPGVPRSDLIVARVEDPNIEGAGWSSPLPDGPFIFSRVLPGVPATTLTLQQIYPTQSGIALARIDIPGGTGTITTAMIKPLTSLVDLATGGQTIDDPASGTPVLATPSYQATKVGATPSNLTPAQTTFIDWPSTAWWDVPIPSWATHGHVEVMLYNVAHWGGGTGIWGQLELMMDGVTQYQAPFDKNDMGSDIGGGNRSDFPLISPSPVAIPSALRGRVKRFKVRGRQETGPPAPTSTIGVDSSSIFVLKIKFLRLP
jgi:hypothetical protein